MDRDQLKALVNLIFDTAEKYFAGRPLIVIALNAAQHVVVDSLLDKLVAEARAKGLSFNPTA